MHIKRLLCTLLLTLPTTVTAFASGYTAQTITITSEAVPTAAIEVTDAKIITDNFSFKVPERWAGECVVIHDGVTLELYDKDSYDEDSSGLLFTIAAYEDSSYQNISASTVLGFSGNTTYVLIHDYIDTYEDSDSSEYRTCKKSVKTLKDSFVVFISE